MNNDNNNNNNRYDILKALKIFLVLVDLEE